MNDFTPIYVAHATFKKVQKLAILAGSETAAIERLISHWELSASCVEPQKSSNAAATVNLWRSPSGDVLKVGERLESSDGGKTHFATVERTGIKYADKIYETPSAAARAVKEKRGLLGTSANTNGRDFWKLRDPNSNRLVPLSALRPTHKIDSDALLAQLEALPTTVNAGTL